MTASTQAVLCLVVPLLGALGIVLTGRRPNVREGVTLVTAGLLCTLVVGLYGPVSRGEIVAATLVADAVPGVALAFTVEPLGLMYAMLASFLWILNSVYSIGYMRGTNEKQQTIYYTCFSLALASVIGIAFAGNLFTLFVFYEALTLSTYPLVTHRRNESAMRAGRVYFGVLVTTSILFQLAAIIWVHVLTGDGTFQPGGVFAGVAAATPGVLVTLYLLFVYGIGKAAVMPVHRWLPAAMVAPTPVSALLHAVAVVKAGVFAVLKVTVYTFGAPFQPGDLPGFADVAVVLAAFTIIAASLVALWQDNLKRRLAYSTIGQLSYIVLGAALLTPYAVAGGALHMVMHGFGKITLFFCAGAIYVAAHKTEISRLNGIGYRMPWTMAAFTAGSLSIIGLPPLGGTWSKWWLIVGATSADRLWVVGVLMLASLLAIGYLVPIIVRAWFCQPDSADADIREAPPAVLVPLLVTAAGCVVLFIWPDPLVGLAEQIGVQR